MTVYLPTSHCFQYRHVALHFVVACPGTHSKSTMFAMRLLTQARTKRSKESRTRLSKVPVTVPARFRILFLSFATGSRISERWSCKPTTRGSPSCLGCIERPLAKCRTTASVVSFDTKFILNACVYSPLTKCLRLNGGMCGIISKINIIKHV